MAVRAAADSSCSIIGSAPPLSSVFRCRRRINHFATPKFRRSRELLWVSNVGGLFRSCFIHSLVDSVMEELEEIRKSRNRPHTRATFKMGTMSTGELVVDKLQKRALHKGLLLEFRKDSERILLAVAQRPDGKKNWMVIDQNGVTSSIKPQQISYIIPGVENFEHTEISDFIQKADANFDPTLLEFAWAELLDRDQSVTLKN